MKNERSVIDALLDWLIDLHARGGDFSAEAVQAAGEAAIAAEVAGMSSQDCFEAGRAAYFDAITGAPNDRSAVA